MHRRKTPVLIKFFGQQRKEKANLRVFPLFTGKRENTKRRLRSTGTMSYAKDTTTRSGDTILQMEAADEQERLDRTKTLCVEQRFASTEREVEKKSSYRGGNDSERCPRRTFPALWFLAGR